MKKQILTGIVALGMAAGAFAQGTIAFDNQFNVNLTAGATNSGGVFKQGALDGSDFNVALYGGSSAANMTLIATLLQSAGQVLSGNTIGAPGLWLDNSGAEYPVAGVPALGTGFFQVQAWEGSFNDYASAVAGGAFAGQSSVFQNATGGGAVSAPDLTGLPSFTLTASVVPEPTTLALCGLGAASLLLFRRKK